MNYAFLSLHSWQTIVANCKGETNERLKQKEIELNSHHGQALKLPSLFQTLNIYSLWASKFFVILFSIVNVRIHIINSFILILKISIKFWTLCNVKIQEKAKVHCMLSSFLLKATVFFRSLSFLSNKERARSWNLFFFWSTSTDQTAVAAANNLNKQHFEWPSISVSTIKKWFLSITNRFTFAWILGVSLKSIKKSGTFRRNRQNNHSIFFLCNCYTLWDCASRARAFHPQQKIN